VSGNREPGAELIRAGMAWHFKKYSDDIRLGRLEQQARREHVGLWSDPTDCTLGPKEHERSEIKISLNRSILSNSPSYSQ